MSKKEKYYAILDIGSKKGEEMDLDDANLLHIRLITEYPELKEELYDLYNIMIDAIDAGEPQQTEINFYIDSVKDLLNEEETTSFPNKLTLSFAPYDYKGE